MRSRSFKLSRDHKWTRQHVSKKYEKTYFQNIIELLKVVAMSLLFLLDKVWRLLRKTGEMKLARKDVWFTVDDLRLYIMIILFKIDWIKTVSNVKKGRNANQWPTNAIVLGADEYMTSGERLNNFHGFIDLAETQIFGNSSSSSTRCIIHFFFEKKSKLPKLFRSPKCNEQPFSCLMNEAVLAT